MSRSPGLRLLDALETGRALLWPRALAPLAPWAFLLPALLFTGLLVVALVPLGDASLRQLDRATFRLAESWSLANYTALVARPVYGVMALRTLLGALIVTLVTLLLAFPYAWLMVRTSSPGLRRLLLISLFLPFFVGQVVRAYGWLIVLGQQGLANSLLGALGLPPLTILYTFPGVLVGLVQYMLPFAVLMLAPALTAVPEEVELASAGLGATPLRTLGRVVLPLARPGLVAAGVVVFTLTLTDFAMPEIMGGGTNDFIASAVYDAFFQLGDPGLGAAIAVMMTAVGSLAVGLALALFGLGTLGYVEARR
jgi:putative spermidine/putrescine transport system permease protein